MCGPLGVKTAWVVSVQGSCLAHAFVDTDVLENRKTGTLVYKIRGALQNVRGHTEPR